MLCVLAPAPLRCEVCKMPYNGVKSLGCGVFIDSVTKSITSTVKDANKVKCEGCDEEKAATMHCVDCGQNFGYSCISVHRKMKMSASHQLIPLHDALKWKVEVKRVPRCKKHLSGDRHLLQDLQGGCLPKMHHREAFWASIFSPGRDGRRVAKRSCRIQHYHESE